MRSCRLESKFESAEQRQSEIDDRQWGSQSTACSVDFAKGYATNDTERAKLWDIQDQKIEAYGKKIVDVKFHGQANETPVPASIKVDVSDVARNVASMGRLLRARFDLHFTNHRPHLLDGKWRFENDDQ